MKILNFAFSLILFACITSCGDDDMDNPIEFPEPPTVDFAMNQTVDIASTVLIEANVSSTTGSITYGWSVTDPDGQPVNVSNDKMISFDADKPGIYDVMVSVTTEGGTTTESGQVNVTNPTYVTIDQMGRPAINTVFNFFSSGETKNNYNMTTPEGGNADPAAFKAILDALQRYAGLDAAAYRNVLGLDNATTAAVLSSDVLMSNKNFPSTYGPTDLSNLSLGENLLNGRGLNDDVVDVTLILAFGGDLSNLTEVQAGLISDNVHENDVSHSDSFPYLAPAN